MEKRLTTPRQWCEAKNDLKNEFGYSYIWCRLNAIENILGEEYDLEQLRRLMQKERALSAAQKQYHPLVCYDVEKGLFLEKPLKKRNRFIAFLSRIIYNKRDRRR